MRFLGGIRLAAIGPSTAEALRRYHLEADLMPPEYRSEILAAALKPHVVGTRVLLARADRGREVLRDELQGVAKVDQVAVYSQTDAAQPDAAVVDSLRKGEVDVVVLTSSNIARSLSRILDTSCQVHLRSGKSRVVSISPVTSATIRELGWPVALEAAEYTIDGIVNALVKFAECGGANARP
jgi:uroporphyrinogen III methyltransferase/synthase